MDALVFNDYNLNVAKYVIRNSKETISEDKRMVVGGGNEKEVRKRITDSLKKVKGVKL